MPEYIPQWIALPDEAETPAGRTDETDKSPSVSSVSATERDGGRNLAHLRRDSALDGRVVYRGSVEAAMPPTGWDGALPAACGWPDLCRRLGPCPRYPDTPCRLEGGNDAG
jgi:hypothetical protein